MPGKWFFEIPDDPQVMTKLVDAIPSSWSWVDGFLEAPGSLKDSGEAIADTTLWLSRFHMINATIRGVRTAGQAKRPDLFGILLEHKLPGLVRFDEAGYAAHGIEDITLELTKKFANAFIAKGYRGQLTFFSGCYDNNKYENPERCSLNFGPWHGGMVSDEAGMQPSRIRVQWSEQHGGNEKNTTSIVAECRSLGLREYELATA